MKNQRESLLEHPRTGEREKRENAKNRILVVDDDASVREMLTRVLVGEGYSVWAAATGTAALEIAAVAKVELVLLDLNLPDKSGWDTFERLTAENPLLIVVIVTARANQLFTALGSGVAALLEKPLDFPKFLQIINGLLAEPVESRLARIAGMPGDFHYMRPRSKELKK